MSTENPRLQQRCITSMQSYGTDFSTVLSHFQMLCGNQDERCRTVRGVRVFSPHFDIVVQRMEDLRRPM